jgi:hypothetical protein
MKTSQTEHIEGDGLAIVTPNKKSFDVLSRVVRHTNRPNKYAIRLVSETPRRKRDNWACWSASPDSSYRAQFSRRSIVLVPIRLANPTVITTATVSIPVPAALQAMDSGQTASGQTGFSSWDRMLEAITKRGAIHFTDANGVLTSIPLQQVVKIVGQ